MNDPRRINPDVDFQASLLAEKVARRVMTLDAAAAELSDWQDEALTGEGGERWRPVQPRALIVTHMMNRLLKRRF